MGGLAPVLTIDPDAEVVIMGDTMSDGPSGSVSRSAGGQALTNDDARRRNASRHEAMAMLEGAVPASTEIDWDNFQELLLSESPPNASPSHGNGSPDTTDMDPFRDQEEVETVERPEVPTPSQHAVLPAVTPSLRVVSNDLTDASLVVTPKEARIARRNSRIPTPSRTLPNSDQPAPFAAPRRYSKPLSPVADTFPPTRFPSEQITQRFQADDSGPNTQQAQQASPVLPLRMSAIPTTKKDRSTSKARLAMSKVGRLLHPKRDTKLASTSNSNPKRPDRSSKTKINFVEKPLVVPSRHAEHHAPLHRRPSQQPTASAFAHHARMPGGRGSAATISTATAPAAPQAAAQPLPRSLADKKLPVLPHTPTPTPAASSTSGHAAPRDTTSTPSPNTNTNTTQPAHALATPAEKDTKAMALYMLQQTASMASAGRGAVLDITSQ
ncbi:uncharacterized protein K452DRAFT_59791 [Aplosporella prunicola CBS 121167]|uniref:Uncharacterized protein n=1 Tax=Aplosporella prunicola CBS 121167 TaxID=1176127 RepID=A0A6A6B9P5_9PEZI|nr:uncharacterized protein K452DRAFT_59791 [Aplosporella prunicola CBS 121167]KAF2140035.1 hypothetical protein K452DRAFT_59791 [Aplosporella prunicola CBS 121167]